MTPTVPADVNVQDKVELPDPPAIVVGVRVHALLSDARATSPVNPLRLVTVIVESAGLLTTALTVVGFAVIVKFCGAPKVNVAIAECEDVPGLPLPVMFT